MTSESCEDARYGSRPYDETDEGRADGGDDLTTGLQVAFEIAFKRLTIEEYHQPYRLSSLSESPDGTPGGSTFLFLL